MPLFDVIQRGETRAKFHNETNFHYLNTSARPGIAAIRNLLEDWFDHFPDAGRADIRGRFRSGDEVQYQSAFFELFWHELLRCSGYELEIHPAMAGVPTNPDFLAKRGGVPQFYVEATLAMPPGDPGADRRFAEFHDALNRLDSPDFFLEVQYRGDPAANIRGRAMRERLERWLRSLNHAEIGRLYEERNYGAVPTLTVSEQGLTLTFTPLPKGPQFRGQPGARPIGIVMPMDMRELRTHDDIRSAIDGKAIKYGAFDYPLIVGVNILDDFCDNSDVWNALFGEEQIVVTRQADGQYRHDWGAHILMNCDSTMLRRAQVCGSTGNKCPRVTEGTTSSWWVEV